MNKEKFNDAHTKLKCGYTNGGQRFKIYVQQQATY